MTEQVSVSRELLATLALGRHQDHEARAEACRILAAKGSSEFVLLPRECPSWLEDIYDEQCEKDGMPCELYLPAYDAMVEALDAASQPK